jgi:small ligand-binding sensory domain FIST
MCVIGLGLETGDTFRFYLPDSATAVSSAANVSNHLRSFKQGTTTGGDKREVFGGLVFTCIHDELSVGQPSVDSSSFLDNFPGVTLGVTICNGKIRRDGLTGYVKESQEQEVVSCVDEFGATYLIMSYVP